ncbi:NAD(P)-dependent oxidoreductase [Nocardia sp. NPDC004068]|uniref:NAD(P)-dependent oxidoreductase n=1 Tax=Nocardia sp. NPDC004068 TaxID=3364303 RepID=UPI003696A6CE
MTRSVGFVGAGQMGEPMVARLVGAGHRVVVYARRDEVRERLRALGATVADAAAEAAAQPVVIVCLYDDAQLTEVLGAPGGVLERAARDAVIVSHTTGSIATLRALAAAHPDGPVLLDGPISGGPHDIAAGELTVLLGGPAAAVETVRPVLSAYAGNIVATGGLGTALAVKLINNALFSANAQLVATAVRIGGELGIAERDLLDALSLCSGRSYAAGSIRRGGGVAGFERVVDRFLRKDVAACLEAADSAGIALGPLAAVIADGPFDLV